jgi:hypothetical protein|tara:strand:- start:205 stop:705 length:501 start_codon:yes stop_codon:yes gene_type:complete
MKYIFLFIPILFLFSCEDDEDVVEQNLIEFLKGKVYQQDIPAGKRYVKFDLSLLSEEDTATGGRGKQYEGWTYYEKHDDDIEGKGCFLAGSVSSSNYGLYQMWYTDTIIDNTTQFKLDGIYGQTWIVTKNDDGKISIDYGNVGQTSFIDDGYTEMNLDEFNELDCK